PVVWSRDRGDHWYANVRENLQNLHALGMNLAPDTRVGDVSERRKIDRRDKFSAHPGQDHYHVRPICRNIVESVHELGMILRGEVQRTTVLAELGNQYAVSVSS